MEKLKTTYTNGEPWLADYINTTNERVNELIANDENHIDDAPSDGKLYGRKDGEWSEVDEMKAENVSVDTIEGLTSANVQSALAEIFGKIGLFGPITQAQYNAITTKENRLYFIAKDGELRRIYYNTTLIGRIKEDGEQVNIGFPLVFPIIFG